MNKIFSLIVVAALAASCTLDREPETALADSTFWKSEIDLRGACNKLYADLGGFSHDTRSDELLGNSSDAISTGSRSVPGTDGNWSSPYDRIAICNNIIDKSTNFADNIRNRWIAEAYFFRAYNYFDLVKKYGDVPLILKMIASTDDPDVTRPRDPRETVIQQCYKDLEFAATYLPKIDDMPATDWGRASRSAALAMIVRIGLYEGTYKKYHKTPGGDYKAHLKKSIDAAETMNKEKLHDLFKGSFVDLFLLPAEGRKNKENVFVKIYTGIGGTMHGNSGGLNSVCLTRNLVDEFLYSDGLPREKSALKKEVEIRYSDMTANRDPRLKATIMEAGEPGYKGNYIPFDTQSQNHPFGYAIRKGFIKEDALQGSTDKMLIRYAEVLLSYAEALYEYNGSISNEQLNATVNRVRKRVGFNIELTNEFVKEHGLDMLREIRRERTVEFIDENFRYDDIIRWKIAEDVLPKALVGLIFSTKDTSASFDEMKSRLTTEDGQFKGEQVYDQGNMYVLEESSARSFDPLRDYLYPVPTYEISTSGGKIKQNPNWGNE